MATVALVEGGGAALQQFLQLATSAQEPKSGTPLLALRYHFFLRALEGAFVRCWPAKRVLLSRGRNGGDSDEHDGEGAWFEIALCRECIGMMVTVRHTIDAQHIDCQLLYFGMLTAGV